MMQDAAESCIRRSMDIASARGVWSRCRHFTFILDGKRIVSFGTNSRKTHPLNLLHPYTNRNMEAISQFVGTHSEMKAILKIGDCRGLSLLNVRIDRNGRIAQSRPCRGCMSVIRAAGIREVAYTDGRGGIATQTLFGVPDGPTAHAIFNKRRGM